MKQILIKSPEYYLVLLAMLSGYTPPFSLNLLSVGLAVIVMMQIIFKNKFSGLVIGILFLIANLYMLGALISEFKEFPVFNNGAKQLLFGGLSLLSFNMFCSGIMIYKYLRFDHSNPSINYKAQEV